jgi:hypothetical protein
MFRHILRKGAPEYAGCVSGLSSEIAAQSILGAIFTRCSWRPSYRSSSTTLFKAAGTLLYDILAKLLVRLLVILLKIA